jgi:general L-amino acid transport system substrate-binding protein
MDSKIKPMFGVFVSATAIVLGLALTTACASAQTLKTIRDRGVLNCGVSQGVIGFSAPSDTGDWAGFDVDFCRALASAIFNDDRKVKFLALSANDRFQALQSGKIDVLSRNSTWTISREVDLGLEFSAVTFYDGQGFMVRHKRGVTSALDLGGSKICVQTGTTTELNLNDYFSSNGMKYEAISTATVGEAEKDYDSGRCDVLTTDASALHSERLKMAAPGDHVILPDVISKEPLGPVVRQGDEKWLNIVKWTHFAMVNAEELGVSSATIDDALKSDKPDVKRLVGTEGNFGEQLGLTKDWVVRILKHVGNYSEVYERNVGVKSRLGIPRGLNQLWTRGGIMYAPPLR